MMANYLDSTHEKNASTVYQKSNEQPCPRSQMSHIYSPGYVPPERQRELERANRVYHDSEKDERRRRRYKSGRKSPNSSRSLDPTPDSSQNHRRISLACVACRKARVKCSGDQPACTGCQACGRNCFYVRDTQQTGNGSIEDINGMYSSVYQELPEYSVEREWAPPTNVEDKPNRDSSIYKHIDGYLCLFPFGGVSHRHYEPTRNVPSISSDVFLQTTSTLSLPIRESREAEIEKPNNMTLPVNDFQEHPVEWTGTATSLADRSGNHQQSLEGETIAHRPRGHQSREHDITNAMSDSNTPHGSSLSSPRQTSDSTSACTTLSRDESEGSSSSINEGSDDGSDEEETAFIRRVEKRLALLRDVMDIVYSTSTCLATSDTMVDGETGTPSTTRDGPGNGCYSNNERNKSHDPKGKRPSRKDEQNKDEEGDGEGQQPKRIKSGIYSNQFDPRKFACPYYQRNRYRCEINMNLPRGACYGPGFQTVHRVKEHLYRAHMLPPICPRCDIQLESDIALERHMRQDSPCEIRTKQLRAGINSTTERLLRSRNKDFNKKTEKEKWEYMYDILFPADDRRNRPSPYHENLAEINFVEDSPHPKSTAKRYNEFLQRELFQRIYRILENQIDEALDLAERDVTGTLKGQLQGIVHNVQTDLYEEFQVSIAKENEQNVDGPVESDTQIPMLEPEAIPSYCLSSSPLRAPWPALELSHQPTTRTPPQCQIYRASNLTLTLFLTLSESTRVEIPI